MIKLRPHHLICTQSFVGEGYSNDFIDNMANIVENLRNSKSCMVQIIFSTDDICQKCPSMLGENICSSNEKVNRYDSKVIKYFDIKEKIYNYNEIANHIKQQVNEEILEDICGDCRWREICAEKIINPL